MEDIYVTKTFLPPIEEYEQYLKQIWQSSQVTNQGALLRQFEKNASAYLDVDNFHFVSNGTIALQLAIKALDIDEGEIITTSFSYVATVSAILWEKCSPVFVDIDPGTFCIDPEKIEAAITKNTKAIMPVHVFGNPCEMDYIERIAKKHNLKVIYDAAHAFGVKTTRGSLLDRGDISTCSFHATKLFHTTEGGAVITPHKEVSEKIELLKRFGHNKDEHIMLGINAKASELHAAMGLCNLKYIDKLISERKVLADEYDRHLDFSKVSKQKLNKQIMVEYNYSYYPIVLKSEQVLLEVLQKLSGIRVFPRRYFYPSLNMLPYLGGQQSCPVSEDICGRILCLPLYVGIDLKVIKNICEVINETE